MEVGYGFLIKVLDDGGADGGKPKLSPPLPVSTSKIGFSLLDISESSPRLMTTIDALQSRSSGGMQGRLGCQGSDSECCQQAASYRLPAGQHHVQAAPFGTFPTVGNANLAPPHTLTRVPTTSVDT